ncbi:hypothetical protein [Mesorhizobium sp. M1405]|uniref:hypothetical protein n=1 Tax=Mesorhizobium sp. M1405 TaxID=2957098 RepID=UPI003339AD71
MELAIQARRNRGLTMHINKIHSVRTIALPETWLDEGWFADIAIETELEDGLIWVYSPDDENGVMASPNSASKAFQNIIAVHRDENK